MAYLQFQIEQLRQWLLSLFVLQVLKMDDFPEHLSNFSFLHAYALC